ncbi:MAG: GFA family protein [Gammaproteobacteria bacterium]
MSSSIEAKGSCLCGAVEIKAQSMNTDVGACHCSTCRKWTGGPLLAVDCTSDVSISGEENITIYDSSEWAERGFCSKCGTHLFYRLKANNQYFVPVGFFDVGEGVHLGHQIFTDEKPDYYAFSNKTKNMTGAEVFAAFAGEQT